MDARRNAHNCGFTLIETVIAAGVLAAAIAGVAGVWTMTGKSTAMARHQTLALQLARDRLEQLANLAWSVRSIDGLDVIASDVTTDLSRSPATSGGSGTLPSPPDTLVRSVAGYADYLDGQGGLVGGGESPPEGARFVRRWAVARQGEGASEMLVFQVMVATVDAEARGLATVTWWRHPDVVWLCGARLRRRV